MKIDYLCNYCGKQDSQYIWNDESLVKCLSCGDNNIKELDPKDIKKSDVFGYEYKKDKK